MELFDKFKLKYMVYMLFEVIIFILKFKLFVLLILIMIKGSEILSLL